MPHTLLVVDDDPSILDVVKRHLERHAFHVWAANNGAQALTLIGDIHPDLVLSDVEMPVLNGQTLCRVLRQEASARSIPLILMSGAQIQENNILAGLEEGADDYILKPFSLAVLTAKIEAVIRRSENSSQIGKRVRKCGLELDHEGRAVKLNGRKITLTRKEFDLLDQLVGKAGRVLSVAYLLETVWGYDTSDYSGRGTVETHISCLRRKMGPDLAKRIVNVTGHGYKFEDQ